jgi:rhodanese-related sulfurtransferase
MSRKDISPQEFIELANPPLLIDVRSRFEYATGRVPKARNLSLPRILLGRIDRLKKWVLPSWFRELPKERPIAVICLTAHRSPIVADALTKEGFQQVFNITGGMREWRHLGLTIEK